ncbi:hypothetical protein EJ05DRAFT_487775 [Pseudovirgaria hyperparasitica]|uniref:Uncharacterized protein n=1 Tax=Pseudovirgaria hyperparasitica TaxID=470096 RepID=A0A6A6W0C3_9PEZI|nr:uncharacterized protein EJ05DRAFT_487775 [Pseudovirgaria hyperparasitica]KAF2755955.1 hypothetical protein EJ05DRAFT_487775 [Pseudovirgaria hyperparasitica]
MGDRTASPPLEMRRSTSTPFLREQRQTTRAATFAEGVRPTQPPGLTRRRSSLFSSSSFDDARHSIKSSTDDLLSPGALEKLTSEDTSHWHSVPLVFAILPAVGGLLFNNGSSVVTDILLLGLSTMFLNWCVRTPWDWYNSAQHVLIISKQIDDEPSETIFEEDSDAEENTGQDQKPSDSILTPAAEPIGQQKQKQRQTDEQKYASAELRRNELLSLAACFAGPVLGAYLLHYIRSYLTRPSEGLVSNYNLTIFVLAAELRPVSHLIRLQRARIMHLQRIVQREPSPPEAVDSQAVQDILMRVEAIESRAAEQETRDGTDLSQKDTRVTEISASVRQTVQPQLDALNRAVRRYEKRYTTQTIQNEARLHDLEVRLKDALSLAAAAARTGQKPGVIAKLLQWISSCCSFWMNGIFSIIIYPFQVFMDLVGGIKHWIAPTGRSEVSRKRPLNKGSAGRHVSPGTGRLHASRGRPR